MEVGIAWFLIVLECTEYMEHSVFGDRIFKILRSSICFNASKSKVSVSLIRFSSLEMFIIICYVPPLCQYRSFLLKEKEQSLITAKYLEMSGWRQVGIVTQRKTNQVSSFLLTIPDTHRFVLVSISTVKLPYPHFCLLHFPSPWCFCFCCLRKATIAGLSAKGFSLCGAAA